MIKLPIVVIASLALTSARAQAQDEDAAMLVVMGVAANDVLNARAAPDAGAVLLGTLMPNASGISVVAQSTETLDWILIESNGLGERVLSRLCQFIRTASGPTSLQRHRAFWGLELSYSRADVHFAFGEEEFSAGFSPPTSPANRANLWLRSRFDVENEFLVLEAEACSDGMSERSYRYSLLARLEETLLAGCCE